VKPFPEEQFADDNAANRIRYASKFRKTTMLADATVIDWPVNLVPQF